MANPTQQDIQSLTEALNKLNSSVGGGNSRTSSYSRSSSVNGSSMDMEKIKNDIKNNGSIIRQFNEMSKKMVASVKGVSDIYSTLEKNTRNQSDEVRKLNKNLSDFVSKSKDSVKALEDLKKMSDGVKDVMKTYTSNAQSYNNVTKVLDELARKRLDVEKELVNAESQLAKARRQKKSTTSATSEVNKIKQKLGNLDTVFSDTQKHTSKLKDELDESIKVIEKYNGVTGALSDAQLQNLKNYKNINIAGKDYKDTIDALNVTSKHFDNGLGQVANTLLNRSKTISTAFDNFGSSMKKAAMQLLTIAPMKAYGDLMAQLKNNVNESDYKHDALMGVSETERSNIIGENRTGLRVLGNGNEQQGFRGGGREIQKAGWQYGVTGGDALKLGLQYQNSLMNSGFNGNAKDTADQMTVMHNFAKDLGVTDGALKDFYDSLNDMGVTAALNQKYANLNDEDRRKAVNLEIKGRVALSQQLGISIERQKQINQEAVNKQFGGVAQAVMQTVAGTQEISKYNSDNPNSKLSADDTSLYQRYRRSGITGMSLDQQKQSQNIAQKIADNREKNITGAAGSGLGGWIGSQISNVEIPKAFGVNVQDETIANITASQRRKGLGNSQVVSNNSYADDQKNIVDSTMNAFVDLNGALTKFNDTIVGTTQTVEGALKNPAGAAAGTAASGLGNFGGSLLGSYIGNKGLGGLARGAGTLARGAAAAGGTELAGLAGGGLAGIATIVAGVLGAAVVGAAIGTLISKAIEGTKAGDAVGSGAAHVMSLLGSSTASDAINRNNAYETSHAASESRLSSLNAVTAAERDAVKARGTGGEVAARQKAESLRSGYKTSYGVDLTGASVGYTAAPSAGLNNMMKTDDNIANQLQSDAKATQDAQADQLAKIAKTNQEMLDIQKKTDQKDDQQTASQAGSTWKQYADHISQVREGIKRS